MLDCPSQSFRPPRDLRPFWQVHLCASRRGCAVSSPFRSSLRQDEYDRFSFTAQEKVILANTKWCPVPRSTGSRSCLSHDPRTRRTILFSWNSTGENRAVALYALSWKRACRKATPGFTARAAIPFYPRYFVSISLSLTITRFRFYEGALIARVNLAPLLRLRAPPRFSPHFSQPRLRSTPR